MTRITRLMGGIVFSGIAANVAWAQTPAAPPVVTVEAPWSRATPPQATTGAVYMKLTSPAGDTLLSATTPAAVKAEVHEMKMDGSVMQMRELPSGLPLPPGQAVTLAPGGYHIMLMGLKTPLKQGQTVTLHLTFAKAPPMDVSAPIAAIGASGPAGMPAHGMGMKM